MQSTTMAAAAAPEQSLTSSEIAQANLHLDQSSNGVIGALAGLSDSRWSFKPAPDVWSIAEITEHIAFVQERVLGLLRDQLPAAPPPPGRDHQAIDRIVIGQFPNRLRKFPAPPALHPTAVSELADALHRVKANTETFRATLAATPDLRRHALESAPLKAITQGEHQFMDGYQWILAASAHTERHTKQMLEVKAHPQFPTA